MIRDVVIEDACRISEIYNYYVMNTTVSCDIEAVTRNYMEEKIIKIKSILPFIVYEKNDEVMGYAYATLWRERKAYRKSVEVSIYVDCNQRGHGIGKKLMESLLEELKKIDIHAAIGGISLPNSASVTLHEKFGFEKVAHFKEVGNKMGKWLDVGYWELILI